VANDSWQHLKSGLDQSRRILCVPTASPYPLKFTWKLRARLAVCRYRPDDQLLAFLETL
jgi:hypothetical protein